MGPDTHADGLLAGALLAVLRRRGVQVGELAGMIGFALLVVGVVFRGVLIHGHAVYWDALGLPLFELAAVLTVGAAIAETSLAEALRSRPLVWFGKISYSLYLWQYAVLRLVDRRLIDALPANEAAAIRSVGALVLSVGGAWLSYRYVEQPFRRRGGASSSRRQRIDAPASVVMGSGRV
jgi:peptidoglycan/LPS O-acetylase OafA/YrhL